MSFDDKQIKKVAHLARLDISDDKLPEYSSNLSNILNLIEKINQVDATNVSPMAHPLSLNQREREDEVTEKNQRENFQSIAPKTDKGLYLVPQVIGNSQNDS